MAFDLKKIIIRKKKELMKRCGLTLSQCQKLVRNFASLGIGEQKHYIKYQKVVLDEKSGIRYVVFYKWRDNNGTLMIELLEIKQQSKKTRKIKLRGVEK